MDTIFVLLLVVSSTFANNTSAVQEEQSEDDCRGINRQARQSDKLRAPFSNHQYTSPSFDYRNAQQQDHTKMRYALQQQVDVANLMKRLQMVSPLPPTRPNQRLRRPKSRSLRQNTPLIIWKVADSSLVHEEPDYRDVNASIQDPDEFERMVNNIELLRKSATKIAANDGQGETVWKKVTTLSKHDDDKYLEQKLHEIDRSDNETELIYIPSDRELLDTNKTISERNDKSPNYDTDLNRQDRAVEDASQPYIAVSPNSLDVGRVTTGIPLPDLTHHKVSGRNLKYLNSLIGKSPDEQLNGLNQLLGRTEKKYAAPTVNKPRPFQVDNQPIESPNNATISEKSSTQPIPGESAAESSRVLTAALHNLPANNYREDFAKLQAQLNAQATAQAEKVLAKAHQQAMEHVAAQHQAIAAEQELATREALARIRSQNHLLPISENVPLDHVPATQHAIQADANLQQTGQHLVALVNLPVEHHLVQVSQAQLPPLDTPNHFQQPQAQVSNNLVQIVESHSLAPQPQVHYSVTSKPDLIQITPNDIVRPKPQISNVGTIGIKKPRPQQIIVPYTHPTFQNQALTLLNAQKTLLEQARPKKTKSKFVHQPLTQYSIHQNHPSSNPNVKLRLSNAQSVEQGHHTPSAFQEVTLQRHQNLQETVPSAFSKSHKEEHDHPYASRYAFGYKIKDVHKGNNFGHEETREGKSTRGKYHVLLPDGRMQKVEYYADPTGYHAKVTYENAAHL